MAGGESFTQATKKHYRNFVEKIYATVKGNSHFSITGFVPEDKMPVYFSAADLVVLPYRLFMSSSGPFSLTLAYKKPFIASHILESYLHTADMKMALQKSHLTKEQFTFNLTSADMREKVKETLAHIDSSAQMQIFTGTLRNARDFNTLIDMYIPLLTPQRDIRDIATQVTGTFIKHSAPFIFQK